MNVPFTFCNKQPKHQGSPDDAHRHTNFAGHGQHVFAAIKLKTQDPSTLPGLAMHVVCSVELADGKRGMGPEGKRLHIPACSRRIEPLC